MQADEEPVDLDADRRRARRSGAQTHVSRVSLNDVSFDNAFWRSVPASERMQLTWDLFLEGCRWQGIDGSKLRLQRSAARLQRRRR